MIDELPKLGDFKVNELIKVIYPDLVESRGIDSCHKVLQILANTAKSKEGESREGQSVLREVGVFDQGGKPATGI